MNKHDSFHSNPEHPATSSHQAALRGPSLPPTSQLIVAVSSPAQSSLPTSTTLHPIPAPTPPVPPRPRRSWSRRSASWSPEEDALLVELVKKETAGPPSISAFKTWSRVAAQLKNRTGKQCRERYLNQLKPGICRDPWTPEEERILHETHSKVGNKWVAIASQLPGRTDNCVKNHWNSMLRKRQRREAALKAAMKEMSATLGKSSASGVNATASATAVADYSTGCSAPGLNATNLVNSRTAPCCNDVSSDMSVVRLAPPMSQGSGGVPVADAERSSNDLSLRTGCATPSGLSAFDTPLSSDVPSPVVACSPVTPLRRDAKLQISTLVSSSSRDISAWQSEADQARKQHNDSAGCLSRDEGVRRPSSVGSGVYGGGRGDCDDGDGCLSGHRVSPWVGGGAVGVVDARVKQSGLNSGDVKDTQYKQATPGFVSYDPGSRVCTVDYISTSQVPGLQNSQCAGDEPGDEAHVGRPLRRSCRLSSNDGGASEKLGEGEMGGREQQRGGNAKLRRLNEGVGNPLAALAIAASSVPPSPLTPESRFSATSHSRSASPERGWRPTRENCVGEKRQIACFRESEAGGYMNGNVLADPLNTARVLDVSGDDDNIASVYTDKREVSRGDVV